MLEKPRSHLIILVDCTLTWNKFQVEDPKILSALAQDLDARAT